MAGPADRDQNAVRSFGVFTSALLARCAWLKRGQIQTIALESTGVYWIALFPILERNGLEVLLVNASHAKNLPARKTDIKDGQSVTAASPLRMVARFLSPARRGLRGAQLPAAARYAD